MVILWQKNLSLNENKIGKISLTIKAGGNSNNSAKIKMKNKEKLIAQYVDNIAETLLNFELTKEVPLTEVQHKKIEQRYAKLGYTVKSYYDNKVGKNIVQFDR